MLIKRWAAFTAVVCGCLCLPLASPRVAHAEGSPEFRGTATLQGQCLASCKLESAKLSYKFGALLGEPTVAGAMAWTARAGTADDCLPWNTTMRLYVGDWFIVLNPSIRRSGQGKGMSGGGSPNWDRLFCNDLGVCASPDEAKTLYRALLGVRGSPPKVRWRLAVVDRPPYDGRLKSRSSFASTVDGEELLHHLEVMRSKRRASVPDRLAWLREEAGKLRAQAPANLRPRLGFILELSNALAKRLPPPPALSRDCADPPPTTQATDLSLPDLQQELESLEKELGKDNELASLMRALIVVAPAVCASGSIPKSASCGFELGQMISAPKTSPLKGVETLQRQSCELAVVGRVLRNPGGPRARFWETVYHTYCLGETPQ